MVFARDDGDPVALRQSRALQVGGQPVGALVERRPGQLPALVDDGDLAWVAARVVPGDVTDEHESSTPSQIRKAMVGMGPPALTRCTVLAASRSPPDRRGGSCARSGPPRWSSRTGTRRGRSWTRRSSCRPSGGDLEVGHGPAHHRRRRLGVPHAGVELRDPAADPGPVVVDVGHGGPRVRAGVHRHPVQRVVVPQRLPLRVARLVGQPRLG